MTEKENTYKISVPLITEKKLREIDNNFKSIADEFIKLFVHDKDLAIAQHIIQKQQEELEHLETNNKKLIEKLEKRRKQNNNRYGQAIDDDEFPEMYEYSGQVQEDDYILKILKGEKE